MSLKSPFLSGLQEEMRMRGYSIRTEKTYLYWIKARSGPQFSDMTLSGRSVLIVPNNTGTDYD
ncbi:phage integrase N-terminal SAM-like domain-containing protein [Klebsiella pneumoniae]|uniref:phage integrase N-terminal SAM-like domain-containing protein n=1 Tax=Klebsiella pneumoniae TaxID=573 RepID=UPI003CC91F71